jgi:hypothetical protein
LQKSRFCSKNTEVYDFQKTRKNAGFLRIFAYFYSFFLQILFKNQKVQKNHKKILFLYQKMPIFHKKPQFLRVF